MGAAKHRAPGRPVERGWTVDPKHRDGSKGPVSADPMNEFAAQWVAAMKLRERQRHLQRQAAWS